MVFSNNLIELFKELSRFILFVQIVLSKTENRAIPIPIMSDGEMDEEESTINAHPTRLVLHPLVLSRNTPRYFLFGAKHTKKKPNK